MFCSIFNMKNNEWPNYKQVLTEWNMWKLFSSCTSKTLIAYVRKILLLLELAMDINNNNGCKILNHKSDNCKWMSLQAHKHGYSTDLFNDV